MAQDTSTNETRFHGTGVSPGIVRGTVYVHRVEAEQEITPYKVAPEAVPSEVARFEAALIATRQQILAMQEKIAEAIGAEDAAIFDAHLLVVEDRTLIDEVLRTLERDLVNVDYIFQQVADRYARTLGQIDDPYLKERVLDINDVAGRVLRNLAGRSHQSLLELRSPHIVVAHNLTPSDTAQLNREYVLGFATEAGSKTSHTAIMAKALGLPSVVGLQHATELLKSGDQVLLDGYKGILILNPTPETLWLYGEIEAKKDQIAEQLTGLKHTASTTVDGRHITLSANIELPEEIQQVKDSGAEGVGLYRTEFFYIRKESLPDEEEQYENYSEVARRLYPESVIIRTLDIGGDKLMSGLDLPHELNPFLGLRAIRLCLEQPDLFKVQLRAILRASVHGKVRLMFPMISGLQEFRKAKAMLEECRIELRNEGKPFDEALEIGVMIEIPGAALIAPTLAREVSFFSIGTNDLIQYTLAVDRLNERIAHLYEPTHPAILNLIKQTVDAAHSAGIWVGVCGEMAGDILMTPLLLGLGVDELSAGPALVPQVKRAVQALDSVRCRELAVEVLQMDSPTGILSKCEEMARTHYSELLE